MEAKPAVELNRSVAPSDNIYFVAPDGMAPERWIVMALSAGDMTSSAFSIANTTRDEAVRECVRLIALGVL